jgi:hypothetical protein
MQLLDDQVGSGGPLEQLAIRVVGGDEVIDTLHELLDANERAAADRLVGDQREEMFDLAEPGALGRNKVHVPSRPARQPRLDLRVAVDGLVVGDA